MNDSMRMHVLECLDRLTDVVASLSLSEEFLLSEFVEQGAISLLNQEIKAVSFLDMLVHIQDVLMFKEGLDLDLPDQSLDQCFCHFF